MSLQRRIVLTLALGSVALTVLVFAGTRVTNCLGPLGRTQVQSLADGCAPLYADPSTLVWPAFLVALIALWFSPRGQHLRPAALGALAGAALGVAIYASTRATSLTGPISTGEVITVVLPFDWIVAATAAVSGGCVGWVLLVSLAGLRRRLAAR